MFRSLHLLLKALDDIEKAAERVIQRIRTLIDVIQLAIEKYKELLALLTDDEDERVKKLEAVIQSLKDETTRMNNLLNENKGETNG